MYTKINTSFVFALLVALCCFSFADTAQAQNKKVAKRSQTKSALKLSNTAQVFQKRNNSLKQKANASQDRARAYQNAKSEFAATERNENTDVHYILGYKVAFPTNAQPKGETAVTTIELLSKGNTKAAVLHFYGDAAKALSSKTVKVDDDKVLHLNYHSDMLPNILNFLSVSDKTVIVHDTEKKSAYLGSGTLR